MADNRSLKSRGDDDLNTAWLMQCSDCTTTYATKENGAREIGSMRQFTFDRPRNQPAVSS